jgi:4-hydroxy-3-methylbut-2-en-1-yl diphosphate synthase IspG/GcpE
VKIGGANPIAVQSMTATRTQDVAATIRQVELLEAAGADVIRIAVDNPKDVTALAEIRAARPNANLSIDLQENYRLAEKVAPYVQKLRYNPGHLYHIERDKPVQDKVRYLVDVARAHGCAMRIGVNAGSVDPDKLAKYDREDSITPMLESALEHCAMLDDIGSPATVATNGPRYFGYVIGGSHDASLAASWLATAWDQNAAYADMSPAASTIERIGWPWPPPAEKLEESLSS